MTHNPVPDRAILSLNGPDTIALLERTVTHSVSDWPTGGMRYGALLTPQGKIIADYIAKRTKTGVLLDTHEEAASDLLKRLKMFRLRADVDLQEETGLCSVLADDGQSDPRSNALPRRAIIAKSEAGSLAQDWNGLRIAAGIPEWGADYRAGEVFPTDINMDVMGGIDYRKGCFIGQEVASRMKRRGKIRKRTLLVQGEALKAGEDILAENPIGQMTSASAHIGLALIRIDRMVAAEMANTPLTCQGEPVIVGKPAWLTEEIDALSANDR